MYLDKEKISYQQKRIAHWNRISTIRRENKRAGEYYHQLLQRYYRFLIPPGLRVLELGCGHGDLLVGLKPSFGVGVDFSGKMVLKTDFHAIHRKHVCYAVDLSEGIDLLLFLFGNFQDHVTRQKHFHIPDDAVVFDVGANIGSMTFRFAQLAPRGHIYAFEPTF